MQFISFEEMILSVSLHRNLMIPMREEPTMFQIDGIILSLMSGSIIFIA